MLKTLNIETLHKYTKQINKLSVGMQPMQYIYNTTFELFNNLHTYKHNASYALLVYVQIETIKSMIIHIEIVSPINKSMVCTKLE